MIRSIEGPVLSVGVASAVIEVAGFGIEVRLSSPETLLPGTRARLATYLAVRQDGMDLYGFPSEEDRDFFELILSVSGIGPKTALGILRRAPREALMGAIGTRDVPYLTKVVGLGKKSAEKMVVELSEKVPGAASGGEDGDVFDMLVALGYTEREARKALQAVDAGISGKDARLKAALSQKT